MTTDHFTLTIGVAPGYFHANRGKTTLDPTGLVPLWQELIAEEYGRSEINVPAVIQEGRSAYSQGKGCPADGEIIAVIFGTRNSHFITCSMMEWRQAVIRIAVALRERLGQTTCQVAFHEVEFTYIK